MAADIVFDQSQGDSISLQADRVRLTGRINLPHIEGVQPPAGGQYGDLVVTVEETDNQLLNITTTTTRLWLCVRPDGMSIQEPGQTWWCEVQLGPVTAIGG
jgi:hypothetical protein